MPLVKPCPSCDGRIVGLGSASVLSLVRHPTQARCPHCGALLKGSLGYWLVAHVGGVMTGIGALGLLALTVNLVSPAYTLGSFVVTGVGMTTMFFGLSRMQLEEV
ncbi:MAG: hypothetical protein P8Y29_00635 [Gemmatimonadota bacterium]|jgi:hypothetical protein